MIRQKGQKINKWQIFDEQRYITVFIYVKTRIKKLTIINIHQPAMSFMLFSFKSKHV